MPQLSVIIPCKNERMNIRPCIESVCEIADEVVVADSGSTDGTLDIARSLGCRIIEREYIHSGDFKNWAIPQATHDWVLLLDADERATPQLRAEVRAILAREPEFDGFEIYRDSFYLGHRVRHCGWDRDHLVRLFRRDVSRYHGDTDHAQLVVSTGRVGWLRGKIDHYTLWSYDQYLNKLHRYTRWQAQQWHQQGKRPSVWRLLAKAPLTFFKFYVVNLGFLDGAVGIQISTMAAFYSFLKEARLWELHVAVPQPDPEAEHAARTMAPRRAA